MERFCVDLSVVASLLLPTRRSAAAEAVFTRVPEADVIAPSLLDAEVATLLRVRVARGDLGLEDADKLFGAFLDLGVRTLDTRATAKRSWDLARYLGFPRAQDAVYLAFAEDLGCDLWTADRRFHARVASSVPWVRLVE